MLRRSAAILLALLAVTPSVAAFPSAQEALSISYALGGTPTMISAGALFLDGTLSNGLVIAGSTGTTFDRIPELRIIDRTQILESRTTHRGATVELVSGALVWAFSEGNAAQLATAEAYAVAIALPEAPLPSDDGATPAGFLLASEAITGTVNWTRGEGGLIPLDAVVTIRDAAGQPLPGWNGRRVNSDATASDDPEGLQVVFEATGAFTARIAANVLGGATASAEGMRLVIGPAEEDRFAQTTAVFDEASSGLFAGAAASTPGAPSPLEIFQPVSGLLNGAIVLVPGAAGGEGAAPVLLASTFGGEEFPLGPFNLVRGDDLELAWSPTKMEIRGEPTVALGRDGFGVDEPTTVGIFPVLSLVLWLIAIGAVVFFFVKRPPKAKGPITLRLASMAIWIVALLITFLLWDRSFAQSFGTSALSVARAEGINGDTMSTIGIILGLELMPWSIAALLFALPVRIAAGVGLRYLGRGKAFKGVATAAGLVSLAIFGPIYALWCFNLVWARIAEAMPAVGP